MDEEIIYDYVDVSDRLEVWDGADGYVEISIENVGSFAVILLPAEEIVTLHSKLGELIREVLK